jgi:RHS repeat-associated protein
VVAETRYLPYGEERWITGTLVTDFTFTGQRAERGFALMDYNARYYDPWLGRFVSADTVVAQAGNPQALNRYAYTYNNPVRHIDPSGHLVPPLNCWVCGLQIDISGWPGFAKRLASVVGSATDFHVDLEQGLITGPTEQEWIESSLTNMVNPIGMVSMPAENAGRQVIEEASDEVIRFYHGTNNAGATSIRSQGIDLSFGRLNADFNPAGQKGFYVTRDYAQAQSWSKHMAAENGGNPAILEFAIPKDELLQLRGKTFEGVNGEWKQFVIGGREGTLQHAFDFVEGPFLANPAHTLGGLPPRGEGHQLAIFTEKAVALFQRNLLP